MEMTGRAIVHIDLDTFFVSVERVLNSSLRGKPVIIGGSSDRGVVAACSYEARTYGVHSAMPMKLCKRLCPNAIYIRGDMDQYSKYSHWVTDIISSKAPLFEKASIDEFYLDVSGMDRFYGCLQWSKELTQSISHETGLPVSFGLTPNKTVSKIATGEAKPQGQKQVCNNEVRSFLNPLSIKKIPMLGPQTYKTLRGMGIAYIETLSAMPAELMQQVLGSNGIMLWERANGIDNTPVVAYSEQKSIGTEDTFDSDSTDINRIKALLVRMTEKIAYQLRSKNKLTSCVTVKIRYSNFDTHTMQCRIPYTSCDHTLIPHVKELFDKLYQRRMLIRLVGVRLSHLVAGAYQINLFDDTSEMISLYQAIDRMRKRFGDDKVKRAVVPWK
ncbi:MAG TPA: DNA polymerase IV [Bacteroidia bacterium]|nr:DNA polymerase IV [Bacteroidia bacterium]